LFVLILQKCNWGGSIKTFPPFQYHISQGKSKEVDYLLLIGFPIPLDGFIEYPNMGIEIY
jgi:hypothetical protein